MKKARARADEGKMEQSEVYASQKLETLGQVSEVLSIKKCTIKISIIGGLRPHMLRRYVPHSPMV